MTQSEITRVLNKSIFKVEEYSMGYKRYVAIPRRVFKTILIDSFLETGEVCTIDDIKKKFDKMSEIEYYEFLEKA